MKELWVSHDYRYQRWEIDLMGVYRIILNRNFIILKANNGDRGSRYYRHKWPFDSSKAARIRYDELQKQMESIHIKFK